MSAAPKQPKRRGRPHKPAEELASERVELRLTPAERDKLRDLGGARWLRPLLHRAKLPTT
jgi:hypothetical protein